jgi:hypothetical protein
LKFRKLALAFADHAKMKREEIISVDVEKGISPIPHSIRISRPNMTVNNQRVHSKLVLP